MADIDAEADELLSMGREARAALPYMHPGRVDVIAAGRLLFARIAARIDSAVKNAGAELDIMVSETDILDGTALDLARTQS